MNMDKENMIQCGFKSLFYYYNLQDHRLYAIMEICLTP